MNMHQHLFASSLANRPQRSLRSIADDLGYSPDWNWSWDNYKNMIVEMSDEYGCKNHLEIGGGRDPLFQPEELQTYDLNVALNDISEQELALAPPAFSKVCCDIASKNTLETLGHEQYDFTYCRMVMEHIPDVEQMWKNIHGLLVPGGAALSFFPTLFAPPFAINHCIPEKLSRAILHTVFPDRKDDGDNPKFPAYYNQCRSSETAIVPILKDIGFSEVTVLPFYGYSYFWKIPVLKQVDAVFTKVARAKDWRVFSSFAYVMARK